MHEKKTLVKEAAPTETDLVICQCKDDQTLQCMEEVLRWPVANFKRGEWDANVVDNQP